MEEIKHRDTYTCKRLRMLTYLRNLGFIPYATVPDYMNPKFMVWKFKNTPELEQAIDDWFAQYEK